MNKEETKISKKRGRKPKGGKIIPNTSNQDIKSDNIVQNVILHLKCNIKHTLDSFTGNFVDAYNNNESYNSSINVSDISIDTNNINKNLNLIKKLHINNNNSDSSCYWCTYDFDNSPIFIPSMLDNHDVYHVYGHFCSPECAAAYLNNEHIDSTVKHERYAMLHNMYSPVYSYDKCIKPAPDPHYTIDRFHGNLSITEYRKLYMNDKFILIIKKPLTKIPFDIYEDNSDFMIKSRIIPSHDKSFMQSTSHTGGLINFCKLTN